MTTRLQYRSAHATSAAGVNMQMILNSYEDLLKRKAIQLDRRGGKTQLHKNAVKEVMDQCKNLSKHMLSSLKRKSLQRSSSLLGAECAILMLGDLKTAETGIENGGSFANQGGAPEAGSCCRVIQMLLQSKLQESVRVVDPVQASERLEQLSEEMASAKVILVILTQGILTEPTFAGAVAACPEEDPAFWEKLAEGKIFSAETLASFSTDFEGVRAAYARLFNVLALKFTSHGSESIQATEIHVMKGRLESMIHDGSKVEKTTSSVSKQRSFTGSAPVAPAVEKPKSSIISADDGSVHSMFM
eukprot:s1178_g3.t1